MTTMMFIGSFSNDDEDAFSKRGRDYFDQRKVSHVGETESLFYFALCPCLQGETGVFCPTLYMTFTARSLCRTG